MSSPPLLPFWASLFFGLFQIKWFFWSMDLFPEAFVANGKMDSKSWLYKIIIKLTYASTPDLLIALGPKQSDYICQHYKTPPPSVILPCGVFKDYQQDSTLPDWKKADGKIYFGYCGNIGAPHSAEFLKEFISLFNPEIHHLVLALYGPKAIEVIEFAKNRKGVTLLENVPRNQLYYIDLHLVSLYPKFNHTAVPSKAISSICTGGSVLFYGSEEADTWYMLQEASWLINFNQDLRNQLASFLQNVTIEKIASKRKSALFLSEKLHLMKIEAYEKIASHLV